jgi:hypothetical protein
MAARAKRCWSLHALRKMSADNAYKRREAAKVLALTASRGVSSKWLVNSLDVPQRKRFHVRQNFMKFLITEKH